MCQVLKERLREQKIYKFLCIACPGKKASFLELSLPNESNSAMLLKSTDNANPKVKDSFRRTAKEK